MGALQMYLKQPNHIYLYTYLWLATLAAANKMILSNTKVIQIPFRSEKGEFGVMDKMFEIIPPRRRFTPAMHPFSVAALGRPLFPGMLYDCHSDSFIPGLTLWDKKSLSEGLESHPLLNTNMELSSSDSLSSKSTFLDVSYSLKASFLGGLMEVKGSASFLSDIKSSNQQFRVTMRYRETTRHDQLTVNQLGEITYPQVFDQKTATHVITAVVYGAQAFMVFDRTFTQEENKDEIEGELRVMFNEFEEYAINGKGSLNLTDKQIQISNGIKYKFYGDFSLDQNPLTFIEALDVYKKLPSLLKNNPQNVVPITVWLYPLNLLNNTAAQLENQISKILVEKIEKVIEDLEKVERICTDLSSNTMLDVFTDINVRLTSFQNYISTHKKKLKDAVARNLPDIRRGIKEESSLEEILNFHSNSPFNAENLNLWLDYIQTELTTLRSLTEELKGIKTISSIDLQSILINPNFNFVVCFTLTSLNHDENLETMEKFQNLNKLLEEKRLLPIPSDKKWFYDSEKLRKNLLLFKSFSNGNKDNKSIHFIISAISDPSSPGSSIYLYENGNLLNKQFQPVSKPPNPIMDVHGQTVSLKLHKSPTGETEHYTVEYKQENIDSKAEEKWNVRSTTNEIYTLTDLEYGKPYMIRYRTVSRVGVSEASDSVSTMPFSGDYQMVGGRGGNDFRFISFSGNLWKISFTCKGRSWFSRSVDPSTPTSMKAFLSTYNAIEAGEHSGENEQEFKITGTIIFAKLWPNTSNTRFGGLYFKIKEGNGEIKEIKFNCGEETLGKSVNIDVKSGICRGIIGRSGNEIDALGFLFM